MFEPHDIADCKPIRFAQLNFEAQRLYPGLDASFWHPVIDKACIAEGVVLRVPGGGGRFVWRHHLRFRDLPLLGS